MRQTYIAGNWKMNKTNSEAVELSRKIVNGSKGSRHRIMIAPPFTALENVYRIVKGSNVILGAQNMSDVEEGAHTGEISVNMLKAIGITTVILGHSERRHIYNETDKVINAKILLALSKGLDVILCVGETIEQRETGNAEAIVIEQLEQGLKNIERNMLEKVTIAYEPVWAIGTGKTATADDADAMHKTIRERVTILYSVQSAQNLIIQYGGSVKPNNIQGLMAMENIDGALVGGASLEAEDFLHIIHFDSK